MSAAASPINGASHLSAFAADLPDPDPVQPPGTSNVTTVLGWAKWVCLAVCILAIFAAGAMMAVQSRRGEGGENVARLGWIMGGVIIISGGASLISFLAT